MIPDRNIQILKICLQKAQTAIEYMVLLSVVAAIVFLGLRTWLGKINDTSTNYFNEVSQGVMDAPPPNLN